MGRVALSVKARLPNQAVVIHCWKSGFTSPTVLTSLPFPHHS